MWVTEASWEVTLLRMLYGPMNAEVKKFFSEQLYWNEWPPSWILAAGRHLASPEQNCWSCEVSFPKRQQFFHEFYLFIFFQATHRSFLVSPSKVQLQPLFRYTLGAVTFRKVSFTCQCVYRKLVCFSLKFHLMIDIVLCVDVLKQQTASLSRNSVSSSSHWRVKHVHTNSRKASVHISSELVLFKSKCKFF